MAPSNRGLVTILRDTTTPSVDYDRHLRTLGFSSQVEQDIPAFYKTLTTRVVQVAIVEVSSDSRGRVEAIKSLRDRGVNVPCIVIASDGNEQLAVSALRAGANDYLKTPMHLGDLNASLNRLVSTTPEDFAEPMVGSHNSTRAMRRYLDRAAAATSTVLITGETGTGKELAASYIHEHSHRRRSAFVSVNCAAMPETLLESELFGYERGAFTGADGARDGKWKQADGGTLFLDEIGEMSASAQAKILRVLDNREVCRLGGSKTQRVDVRVVAATNQEIEKLVEERKFRADLYFRLNVARLHLPPLRERRSDIPLLVKHYVQQMNVTFRQKITGFDSEAMDKLEKYDWPGNIRELKNLVEAAFIELPDNCLDLAELPPAIRARLASMRDMPAEEREQLLGALLQTDWNVSQAAAQLQLSRMTLYRKMAKYQIVRSPRRNTLLQSRQSV
ncbi:MAG TPA: sigma-54 dependent transcriptional regulator [Pyrinomonadaceae bacterium]|nr:sigma-54 dependent transcriptional regulator [Pyrinomonadaceae bacterium]